MWCHLARPCSTPPKMAPMQLDNTHNCKSERDCELHSGSDSKYRAVADYFRLCFTRKAQVRSLPASNTPASQ